MNSPAIMIAGTLGCTLAMGILLGGVQQLAAGESTPLPIEQHVSHGFATNNGVRIHYASVGKGPLVVCIHGFPDYWLTWRDLMTGLSGEYEVVALDQRGYNLSDRPKGVDAYSMANLVEDVGAVIRARGRDKAIIVGHDWGGAVAWTLAMIHPEWVDKLVILNLPHPRGLARELANNPKQQSASGYARKFQMDGSEKDLTAEGLAFWVSDPKAKARYVEAFQRSDFEAMMNYYRRNYPREPYTEDTAPVVRVKGPVLMIHGLGDTALLSPALNGNWDWIDGDLTLVTIPGASHFVQQDATDLVRRSIKSWLSR